MRPGYTVHGFRSSFRDWVSEATSFGPEIAERALAHVVNEETVAAYSRSDLLERRREMMQRWADYLDKRRDEAAGVSLRRVVEA